MTEAKCDFNRNSAPLLIFVGHGREYCHSRSERSRYAGVR